MSLIRNLLFTLLLLVMPMQLWAEAGSITIQIKGISCPFCVYGVEKKLKKVPGIESVTTNYKQSSATLQKQFNSRVDIGALERAVVDAGFTVESITLTVQGDLTHWQKYPALKDASSGQLFLLVEASKSHVDEYLSEARLKELKSRSANGEKALRIKGRAHFHKEMPIALEVTQFEAAP